MIKKIKFELRKLRSILRVKKILGQRDVINLEIGSGPQRGNDEWVTLDICKQSDLTWSLTDGLPFPDGSVNKIYASHVFEHFSYDELQQILSSCHRVLAPEGQLLVCVPNARLYISAYMNDEDLEEWDFYEPALNYHSRIDYVNYAAYMGGHHKHLFDEDNLLSILRSAHFESAQLRSFDPELDLEWRRFESIYAIAHKSKVRALAA